MPDAPKTHLQRQRASGKAPPSQWRKGERTEADKFRSSARWQKCRKVHKRMFPLCCDPFGVHAADGHWEPVAETHHVVPVIEEPELALDFDNLRSLCRVCHARVGAMERAGQETRGLFGKVEVAE